MPDLDSRTGNPPEPGDIPSGVSCNFASPSDYRTPAHQEIASQQTSGARRPAQHQRRRPTCMRSCEYGYDGLADSGGNLDNMQRVHRVSRWTVAIYSVEDEDQVDCSNITGSHQLEMGQPFRTAPTMVALLAAMHRFPPCLPYRFPGLRGHRAPGLHRAIVRRILLRCARRCVDRLRHRLGLG
jgi:hypothetical protein